MTTEQYQLYLDAIENENPYSGGTPQGDRWLSSQRVYQRGDGYGTVYGEQGPDLPEDFDPRHLQLVTVLRDDEDVIQGSEFQRRAVEELGSPWGRKLLWWLLNHEELIPEEWKSDQIKIFFAGDNDLVLGHHLGQPCLLYLRDYRFFLSEPHRMGWGAQAIELYPSPMVGKEARVVVYGR